MLQHDMQLSYLANSEAGWLKKKASRFKTVISCRIRLARNLADYPFPFAASEEQHEEIIHKVFEATRKINYLRGAHLYKLDGLSSIDRRLLLERHIISHRHAISSTGGGVIIDEGEMISIMINEEDHIRLQYISGGFDMTDAWSVINTLDDELSEYLDFAYSPQLGYLTSCPTNTGTGMRASYQIHLPAINMLKELRTTMENINKMGFVVRGIYGEGSRVMGNVLQISNQLTLGISEEHVIDNLNRVVNRATEREYKIQRKVMENDLDALKEMVRRSLGTLLNAEKISFIEAQDLLSDLKFGVYTDIIECDLDSLDDLILRIQSAHIQETCGREMPIEERDIERANKIRNILELVLDKQNLKII